MSKSDKIVSIFIGLIILICIGFGILGLTKKLNTKEPPEEIIEKNDDETDNNKEHYLYIYKKSSGEYCIEKTEDCNIAAVRIKTKTEDAIVLAFDNNKKNTDGKIIEPEYALINDDNLLLINFKEKTSEKINLENDKDSYELIRTYYPDDEAEQKSHLFGIKYYKDSKIGFYGIEQSKELLNGEYLDISISYSENNLFGYTDKIIDSLSLKDNKITTFKNEGNIPLELDNNAKIIRFDVENKNKEILIAYYNQQGHLLTIVDDYHTSVTFKKSAIFKDRLYVIEDNKLNVYNSESLEKTIDISKYDETKSLLHLRDDIENLNNYFIGIKNNILTLLNIDTEEEIKIIEMEKEFNLTPYMNYSKTGDGLITCENALKDGIYINIQINLDDEGYQIYFNPFTKEIEKTKVTFCAGAR